MNLISKIKGKIVYWIFILSKPLIRVSPSNSNPNSVLILTIAYNDDSLIETQINLIKKNFKDPYVHFVVDNSSDLGIRTSILKICQTHHTGYVSVPTNPYSNTKSHGAAMHWAYFQLVKKMKFNYFGFLDHDIFPVAGFSVLSKIQNGIYGRVMHAYFPNGYLNKVSSEVPYWSLWAGFCFFEKQLVRGPFPWSLNFFSKHFKNGYFLDTGGGLWNKVYSQITYPGELANYRLEKDNDSASSEIQDSSFEILDDAWIHFVSLSNWREIQNLNGKKARLTEFLKKCKKE